MKKALLLGSGGLKIGQAGEFDYSGSQAIKALKEEGIEVVVINPNIATIQTSKELTDKVYFLPVNPYFVEQVIKKEKPDGILLAFGGQTALNCGVELDHQGVLKKNSVKVLGTPIASIILTEDREKFANHLRKMGVNTPVSLAATSKTQALKYAEQIGFPVMIRAAYALGGQGSGVAYTSTQLEKMINQAFSFSKQVLVEQYLHHWKEIEYEVVRDAEDNCISVCNMENFDPLGIHTGESIVVAPSQTLTNFEYHFLRQKSIEIVRSLGIVGECNVQYAVKPNPSNVPHIKVNATVNDKIITSALEDLPRGEPTDIQPASLYKGGANILDYAVIEVNARLSRSSALASKATGYPLAYVAAKLALGQTLLDIPNHVTKVTKAFFEPALDYVVVKIPRWDLDKFDEMDHTLGSSMKSVGEVMAVGRCFEEAIQKGVRMLDIEVEGVTRYQFPNADNDFEPFLNIPTPNRIFALTAALKAGWSLEQLYQKTGVDPWFLARLECITKAEQELEHIGNLPSSQLLLKLKQLGFSDIGIGRVINQNFETVRNHRKHLKVLPVIHTIDTLAGEVPAATNYLYCTYLGTETEVKPLGYEGVIVLGSGPYRIGSSVEFDWSCVHTALAFQQRGKHSIVINSNPETVSTDYDMSDRLYFEELSLERVMDIYEFEQPEGVVVSVGGQIPNSLSQSLAQHQVRILGTKPQDIDQAEDRTKFSALLDKVGIDQPPWRQLADLQSALEFGKSVEYPVLVRPSYVLSGSAMRVCFSEAELKSVLIKVGEMSLERPVLLSKFVAFAKELEYDGVAQHGEVIVGALSEHVEYAGVHSGDATIAYPAQRVYLKTVHEIENKVKQLVSALHITGPFNIQFLAKDNRVSVIEVNLRASRTFPLLSKAIGVNFAKVLVDTFYGEAKPLQFPYPDWVIVKVPQFSFARLSGVDPVLRVEMASTGEVACFGKTIEEAYFKSLLSTGFTLNGKTALLTVGGVVNKKLFLNSAKRMVQIGFKLYATFNTHTFLAENGIKSTKVYKLYEKGHPSVLDIITNHQIGLVINISKRFEEDSKARHQMITDGYRIRRAAIECNIPLFTDLNTARLFTKALARYSIEQLEVKAWGDYV